MNNIDLYIEELESVKVEIKDAIIAKGVTPTGGLSSYATAISEIDGATIETDDLGVLINENGSYYYTPEGDGFTSVAVTVDVIPPPVLTQEKDVTITSNGETIVTPDEGFDGLNKVNTIKTNLILCLMRGASYEENLKTIETAYKSMLPINFFF